MNTQHVFVDWKRTRLQAVMEPNDTLFVDINDYVPTDDDLKKSFDAYLDKNKQVLFMGHNARVNNEIYQYKEISSPIQKDQKDDTTYLHAHQKEYNDQINHLNNYIETHPSLSSKFRLYQQNMYKHQKAFNLMQYVYNTYKLTNEYLSYVEENFTFEDNLDFTFTVDFAIFIHDYIYYQNKTINQLTYTDIADRLQKEGKMTPEIEEKVNVLTALEKRHYTSDNEKEKKQLSSQIDNELISFNKISLISTTANTIFSERKKYIKNISYLDLGERISYDGKMTISINDQINDLKSLEQHLDTTAQQKKRDEIIQLFNSKLKTFDTDIIVQAYLQQLGNEWDFLNTALADSLFSNPNLRELWTTKKYVSWFEVLHKPVSPLMLQSFYQKVQNPDLRSKIEELQNYYCSIQNQDITYKASLINTQNLKNITKADSLFNSIIKPYKGKVIYVDFWATWCARCRIDIKRISDIKKQLQNDDIIYLYFAKTSPEETWRNFIKENNLVGKNIVHYRLPNEQHALLEQKFNIAHYPSYLLIDKEGTIVDVNAPSPSDSKNLINRIKELYKK